MLGSHTRVQRWTARRRAGLRACCAARRAPPPPLTRARLALQAHWVTTSSCPGWEVQDNRAISITQDTLTLPVERALLRTDNSYIVHVQVSPSAGNGCACRRASFT